MKKILALLCALSLLLCFVGATAETAGDETTESGGVVLVTPYDNGTGNDVPTGRQYYVYETPGVELDGADSPIIIVLGEEDFTQESAEAAVIELGLEEICTENNCYAVFVGPNGDGWDESDLEYVDEAINLFGETLYFVDNGLFTNANYLSSQDIIYVIAEGAAADFVCDYMLSSDTSRTVVFADYDTPDFTFSFSHVPSGVVLYNPTSDGANIDLGSLGIVAVTVNASEELVEALIEADDATVSEETENGTTYYDPTATYKKVIAVTSENTSGFDGTVLSENFSSILEVKRSQNGESFPLEQNLVWENLGIDEYILEFATSSTNTINYQVYIPQDLDTTQEGTIPLVLSFHGGGETADVNMASTHWPLLGKENGFIVIAVDQHFSEGTLLDETNIDAFMEKIFSDYPCIDQTRVYASGMSMGAIKSWTLGLNATQYFAAIAPFNGVLRDDATGYENVYDDIDTDGLILPVFYTAGQISTMIELPDEDETNYVNQTLSIILAINEVTESYVYDSDSDNIFGITPDYIETSTYYDGYYTMNKNYYLSEDGNCYTVLVDIENLGHETFPFVAEQAWEFLKQFQRNADGSITILTEE